MSASMTEIRWHGRGGQGAKTACLLLADAAFASGKYVQGFPEYGPERMGAPITAYNRISDIPCTIHSNIYAPDYVVVVDESLLSSVDVTAGLKASSTPAASPRSIWAVTFPTPPCFPPSCRSAVSWSRDVSSRIWRPPSAINLPPRPR